MSCEIDLSLLYSTIQNPVTMPDFLRSDYGDPEGPPTDSSGTINTQCFWKIRIYYNGTPYEFKWFYVGQTMRITSIFGQRGKFSFTLLDDDEYDQIFPFIPAEDMWVEVWAGSHMYTCGRIDDVDPTFISQRSDYSEAASYAITCTDLYAELDFKTFKENYENKKLGFILKDVIRNYTQLDASEIDGSLGFTVESFPINKKTPAQVLTHIADLLGMTYWIEPATKKLRLSTKDNADVRYNTTINDQNLYEYFSSTATEGAKRFTLRRQTDQIKNAIELEFNQRYTAGRVNVSTGSNIVVAYGAIPETDWDDLPGGLQFKLKNSDAIYTAEKNNSSGLTQEWRLSSPFAETSATNQEYELRGNRTSIYVSDEESIAVMRMTRGGDGIYPFQVAEDENYFTTAEAYRFALALLVMSRPMPRGEGTTYNSVWLELPLVAGLVIPFNLERSKRFIGDVATQQVDIIDLGGDVEINGEQHPYCQIDMGFTASYTSDQAQWRKVYQDLRRVRVGLDSSEVQKRVQVRETLVLADCIHPVYPIELAQTLELNDSISTREVSDRALFWTEYDFTLSAWSYAFTSD